jgi:aspartyl-tRNA(Asn)/glutamyl-tRNA(Gln) amidotransferase subunit C
VVQASSLPCFNGRQDACPTVREAAVALTADQVRWVAHLARLECQPDEIALFTEQLGKIIDYVEQLKEVNTDGVPPLAHCLPIHNVFRGDETTPSLPASEALANAPLRKGDFYSVPAVLDFEE